MPSAPPPPAQVDPGQSSLDFIKAMSDPALQQQLFAAEQQYRPQYTALELADINALQMGSGGQRGLLELNRIATQQAQEQAQAAASAQRSADIGDVEALGSRASRAFIAANPELAQSLTQAEALRGGGMSVGNDIRQLMSQGQGEQQVTQAGLDFLSRGGNLTPTQLRNVVQQSRVASQSRGRVGDQSGIANETAARLAQEMNLERENVGFGSQLVGQGFGMAQQRRGVDLQGLLGLGQLEQSQQQANRAYAMGLVGARQSTASDPFQAILGRPSQAPGMGMASTQFAAGLAGQPLGPNLFDPNAGINLSLQQQANQANYQSSIYGAQAGYAGASNQGRGAMIGGIAGGVGAGLGAYAGLAAL